MINKHAVLLAMLLPGIAALVGCKDRDGDDAVAPAATATPAAADSMPSEQMPVVNMPAPDAEIADGMSFAGLDKNQDGGITKDELADTHMLNKHFTAADTDGDGKLSQVELIWHIAEMKAAPAK